MSAEDDSDLGGSHSHDIAGRVREELARRRMSRQALADHARISISTLEKALGGARPFTLATTLRLEQALGVALRPVPKAAPAVREPAPAPAAANLGGYARAAVHWLEGDYLTLRPSFGQAGALYAFRTEIFWDAAAHALAFRESERLDAHFAQSGTVSVASKSGHIYLHTNEDGQMRLAILGLPRITGELYGLLTTLQAGQGSQLLPVSAPLALIPMKAGTPAAFGRVVPTDPAFAAYREQLARVVEQGFARFAAA